MKKSICVLLFALFIFMGFFIPLNLVAAKNIAITPPPIPTGTYGRITKITCLQYKSNVTSTCLTKIAVDKFVYVTYGPQNGYYYVQHPVKDYIIYLGWIKKEDIKLVYAPTPRP